MENRSDFRVSLENKRCLVSNIFVPEAVIKNVSGTGISISVSEDILPGIFDIQFSVHGRSFSRKSEIIWKEHTEDGKYIIGLNFVDQCEVERMYLHSVLMVEDAILYQEKKAVGSH